MGVGPLPASPGPSRDPERPESYTEQLLEDPSTRLQNFVQIRPGVQKLFDRFIVGKKERKIDTNQPTEKK